MKLKAVIAVAVAGAFAVPLAAQASAEADRMILAQQSGSTMQPKDSNPAAPPRTFGPGGGEKSSADTTTRPSSGAASGSSTAPSTSGSTAGSTTTGAGAPLHGGSNAADRPANTPKSETGATAEGGFAAVDKNHDGHISRDEAKDAAWSNRFSELDKDNDDRLSRSEFEAMQAGAGATGTTGAPLTGGSNSADRKPNTPKR
jgi:hypothetical protein